MDAAVKPAGDRAAERARTCYATRKRLHGACPIPFFRHKRALAVQIAKVRPDAAACPLEQKAARHDIGRTLLPDVVMTSYEARAIERVNAGV